MSTERVPQHVRIAIRVGELFSDRQWRDVCGLLKLQSGHLDEPYLTRWADALGISDLLERAQRDVGV